MSLVSEVCCTVELSVENIKFDWIATYIYQKIAQKHVEFWAIGQEVTKMFFKSFEQSTLR